MDNGSSFQNGKRNTVSSFDYRSSLFLCLDLSLLPGDLIYLNVAGQPVVVINSPKVGVALLDRRAAIYSGRPRNIVPSIMTGGLFFALSQYGEM